MLPFISRIIWFFLIIKGSKKQWIYGKDGLNTSGCVSGWGDKQICETGTVGRCH